MITKQINVFRLHCSDWLAQTARRVGCDLTPLQHYVLDEFIFKPKTGVSIATGSMAEGSEFESW
jgi:hypothetical protein